MGNDCYKLDLFIGKDENMTTSTDDGKALQMKRCKTEIMPLHQTFSIMGAYTKQ